MILHYDDIAKAFGLGDGPEWLLESEEVLLVMCLSSFDGGIDAIEAIKHVIGHPRSVSGILGLLGDDEIDSVDAAAAAEAAIYHISPNVFRSLDMMRAWVVRQTMLKALKRTGILLS